MDFGNYAIHIQSFHHSKLNHYIKLV
ncbi:hypothetical protein SAMN04488023_15623, partial [Pedobacter rhizosphaerae]